MRFKTALGTMATVCALLATSFAAVPLIIPHQGRLLDSDDKPVTGQRDLTFRIFETPAGGAALWTESHLDVPVSNGLFNVMLGSTITISGDLLVTSGTLETERYLEIQVETDAPLTPRMRIGSAPLAIASSRVSGDITTSPGSLAIGDLNGDGRADIVCAPSLSFVELNDREASGASRLRGVVSGVSPGTTNLSGLYLDCDDDGDFVPDAEAALETKKSGLTVKGSLTLSAGDATRLLDASADPVDVTLEMRAKSQNLGDNENWLFGNASISGASHLVAGDLDQDGLEDLVVSSKVTGVSSELSVQAGELELGTSSALFTVTGQPTPVGESGANMVLSMSKDDDGDGVPEVETELSTSSSGVAHRFAWNSAADLGSEPNRSVVVRITPTDASQIIVADVDGDGNSEQELSLKVLDANSQIDLNAKDAFGNKKSEWSSHCAESYAILVLERFIDTDTIPDIGISSSASTDRAILESFFERGDKPTQSQFSNLLDSDGISATYRSANAVGMTTGLLTTRVTPDSVDESSTVSDGSSSSTSSMRLRLNELESKLQNIGLLARTTVKQDCDDTEASLSIERADASTGTPVVEGTQVLSTSPAGVLHAMTWDSDADGIVDRRFTGDCDDENTGLEISAGVAIPKFIDITARDASSLPGSSSDVSLVMGLGPDTAIDLRVTSQRTRIIFASQNTQSLRQVSITVDDTCGRVAIDTIPTTHKLSIGGGAFCDGTTWTNASDKNAKENFSDVDGAKLLEKIEELPISQWNYKSEDESITHIGPTAQDFKRAFGVGADDKSISTVDPSGIALAAIKELNKQNQELAKQNNELKKELENLKKKVDELISRR